MYSRPAETAVEREKWIARLSIAESTITRPAQLPIRNDLIRPLRRELDSKDGEG